METARAMQDASPMAEKKEWWTTPTVLGLMGFGLTTMLAGLSNLPPPYANGLTYNWVVFGTAIFFGGIAQLLAGLIGLRKGNLFAGTAFVGYGSFWMAFTAMLASFGPAFGGFGPTAITNPAAPYGVAAFFFVWVLFTLTFLINSMKHGWGIFFVFLFLFVSLILLTVKFWQIGAGDSISKGEDWAVGGLITLTGLTAWYVATSDLTNSSYGKTLLPS